MEDIAREMAVDELHIGEEYLRIQACVAKGLLSFFFPLEEHSALK